MRVRPSDGIIWWGGFLGVWWGCLLPLFLSLVIVRRVFWVFNDLRIQKCLSIFYRLKTGFGIGEGSGTQSLQFAMVCRVFL